MGYSTSNPPNMVTQPIADDVLRQWVFTSTDTTITDDSFFSDGYQRGMRKGDILWYYNSTLQTVRLYRVSASTATDGANVIQDIVSTRQQLTEDTTYYVRTGGSDATGDGSANDDAHAFATPQGAYDWLEANVDAAGYLIKIKMGAGTYTASSHRRNTTESSSETTVVTLNANIQNAAAVVFEGDQTTPTNVKWDANGGLCIWGAGGAGIWRFEGIAFRDLAAATDSQALFSNAAGANYSFDNVDFGAFGATSGCHIHLYGPNIVKLFGNYTISGGAQRHIWLEGGGASLDQESSTVTLTGTPAFTAFVQAGSNTEALFISMTFTGSATGYRFVAEDGSILVSPAQDLNSLLPGNATGLWTYGTINNGATATYLESGHVHNWNNGNVTLTHSSGKLSTNAWLATSVTPTSSIPTFDASGQTGTTIADGANASIAGTVYGTIIVAVNTGTGAAIAALVSSASTLTSMAANASWEINTTTPAGGNQSISWDGSSTYKIYNNTGAQRTYNVMVFRGYV